MYLTKDKIIKQFISLCKDSVKLRGNHFDFDLVNRIHKYTDDSENEDIGLSLDNIQMFIKTLNQIDNQLIAELKRDAFLHELLEERENIISGIYTNSSRIKHVIKVAFDRF